MASARLADAFLKGVLADVEAAIAKGFAAPGAASGPGTQHAVRLVADARQVPVQTVSRWVREAAARGFRLEAPARTVSAASPGEAHDASFWRKRAHALGAALDEAEHTLREVSGLIMRPVSPPSWTLPKPGGEEARCRPL